MSKTIQHKRSSVAGNQPNNTQVDVGELGLNFPDRSIYTKDGLGVITELARDVWRTDTAPDSALDGDMWYDTSSGTISIWDGSDWGEITTGGKPVEPDQITSEPPFSEGSGTENDPYVLEPVFANVGDVDVHIGTFTITGLNAGQIVNAVDNNSGTNGGRFKSNNNIADADGTLTFRAYFDDNPETASATTYEGEFKIGSNSIYVNCSVALQKVLEGGTEIPDNVPDGVGGNGPFIWQGSDGRTLTATFPLLISKDGGYFTDEITVDNGDEFWLKWAGDPGSGVGIDESHGTTISGAVTDGVGGSHQCSFTIDKETSFVFHNFVDSDQTVGGLSESRTVTVRDVNSYVYPFGTTTGDSAQYSLNGGDWKDMPATNSGSATDYMVEGDEFQLRHRDAATNNTASTYNFNMAGDSADWTTVTADIDPIIKQPEIESPATDGATGIGTSGPFVSSDFEMAEGVDTHTASSWQIFSEGWSEQSSLKDQVGEYVMKAVAWDGSQFCAVGASARCATSPDGVTWTNQPGLDGASGLDKNDIAWSGTQFCTVGQNGKCATSPDGVTWTNQPGLASATASRTYVGIAWDGSQFCAVADQAAGTSPDGITWTRQSGLYSTMGTSSYAITSGNNLFVVVGQSGRIATSPDGATWTRRSGRSSEKLFGITWSGTQFCAVGRSAVCQTSPDGTTWTLQSNLASVAPGVQFNSVDWNGTQFCAVGANGTAATSPDGVLWTIQPSFNQASGNQVMNGIVAGGDTFVAVGNNSACATFSKALEQSLDSDTSALTSWTPSTTLDYKTDYKVRVRHHTATLNSEWSDARTFETAEKPGAEWKKSTALINLFGSGDFHDVAWNGSVFCAVGDGARVATSPDGVTWTSHLDNFKAAMVGQPDANKDSIYGIVWDYNYNVFVAVGKSGLCATSPDGATWTYRNGIRAQLGSFNMNDVGTGFQSGGAKILAAVGDSSSISKGENGGANWQTSGNTGLNTSYSVVYSGQNPWVSGAFWLILGSSSSSPVVKTLHIGTSYDARTISGAPSGSNWKSLCVNPDTNVFVGVGSIFSGGQYSGAAFTTTDGNTLTYQSGLASVMGPTSNAVFPLDVIWDGNQYVTVGYGGACATSPDGVTWTNRPGLRAQVGDTVMNGVASNGNMLVAVGKSCTLAVSE